MSLRELREGRGLSQLEVAAKASTSQGEISRTESRARGRRITSLRRYVEALGGELLIFAKVGGRMVRLKDT